MKGIVLERNVSVDVAELEKEIAKASKRGIWLKEPGTYSLIITEVKKMKLCPDPSWQNYMISMETVEGLKFNHFLKVPISEKNKLLYRNPAFPEKASTFPTVLLQRFYKGLGIAEASDYAYLHSLSDYIFSNVEDALIGKKIKLRLGYKGLHIRYLGKNENDQNMYQAFNGDSPYEINGEVIEPCPGWEACENLLLSKGIQKKQITAFPEVLEIFEGELFNIASEPVEDTALPF